MTKLYSPVGPEVHRGIIQHLDLQSFFFRVTGAALTVLSVFDSRADNPANPCQDMAKAFAYHWEALAKQSLGAAYGINPHMVYLAYWTQVEVLLDYVEWRNSRRYTEYFPGDEQALKQLVYTALIAANNWKVLNIRDIHATHDRHFGSATEWQKQDLLENVSAWPEYYHVANEIGVILPMPCNEEPEEQQEVDHGF